jgi:hypothetical protein
MNDEMMAHTFVVESMTVEAGRIIPSPALAEAVIGGIAQIIAERDALKAQWAGVPWEHLKEATLRLRAYERITPNASVECLADGLDCWMEDYAPRPRPTTEQLRALVELIRKA